MSLSPLLSAGLGSWFILTTALAPAEIPAASPPRLMETLGPRGNAIGQNNRDEVRLLSGPEPATMLNDQSPRRFELWSNILKVAPQLEVPAA